MDRRLLLIDQNLEQIPAHLASESGLTTTVLDLSFNRIKHVSNLEGFCRLHTLILDNNELVSHQVFPPLPTMRTLWVNNNRIDDLRAFIGSVAQAFSHLRYLSMLGNPACANPLAGSTENETRAYRLYVIQQLRSLKFLDAKPISKAERAAVTRTNAAPSSTYPTSMSYASMPPQQQQQQHYRAGSTAMPAAYSSFNTLPPTSSSSYSSMPGSLQQPQPPLLAAQPNASSSAAGLSDQPGSFAAFGFAPPPSTAAAPTSAPPGFQPQPPVPFQQQPPLPQAPFDPSNPATATTAPTAALPPGPAAQPYSLMQPPPPGGPPYPMPPYGGYPPQSMPGWYPPPGPGAGYPPPPPMAAGSMPPPQGYGAPSAPYMGGVFDDRPMGQIVRTGSQSGARPQHAPSLWKQAPLQFFQHLKGMLFRDYTLIIDKSGSMAGSRWRDAQKAVEALAPGVVRADPDGVGMWFFSGPGQHVYYDGIKSAEQVRELFRRHSPGGTTDLAGVLELAIDQHWRRGGKPETMLIITDGEPNDREAVKRVIIEAANTIERDEDLSLSFIQIGNDKQAHEFLKELDSGLVGARFDIVDEVTQEQMAGYSFSDFIMKSIYD